MGKSSKEKKHKKKHKKEKKYKSKHVKDKKRKHHSESSDSSSSEGEWIEKEPAISSNTKDIPKDRDEWMSMEDIFSGKTRKELNENKKKPEKEKEFNLLDKPGQSSRELNPFWKNGGTGLPPEEPKRTSENKSYDSLKSNNSRRRHSSDSYSSDDGIETKRSNCKESRRYEKNEKEHQSHSWKDKKKLNFKRPDEESEYDRRRESSRQDDRHQDHKKLNFKRPGDDSPPFEQMSRSHDTSRARKNWRKPTSEQTESKPASDRFVWDSNRKVTVEESMEIPEKSEDTKKSSSPDSGVLSLNEMNELSASILKAEIMGNNALAEKLKVKLKEARLKKEASNSKEIYDDKGRKVIVLTETDSRGFERPFTSKAGDKYKNTKGKKKVDTHEGRERVRYFADDDKYSLNDMFVNEKYSTSDDQLATFVKLSGKHKTDGDMAEEAALDVARFDVADKDDQKKRYQAIQKQIKREKILDNCRFCIDTKNASNDCIILVKEKVYLAVPSHQSLTDRHCIIAPQNHIPCATLADEDIWDEIMNLRKKLVKVFEKDDEDVIFFESVMDLKKHPHMVIHCVPVPREVGDTAPIYFKKAILECEYEWSNNKKLVNLAGRDVRKAVPKGLPYFAVDFGLQSGYAHVIEDRQLFPSNFAQEIIGGMLDLDHTIWRKLRRDSDENMKKKVDLLKELVKDI